MAAVATGGSGGSGGHNGGHGHGHGGYGPKWKKQSVITEKTFPLKTTLMSEQSGLKMA